MPYLFEVGVKPSVRGTPVPRHAGLKLFNFNKPCATCGRGAALEFNGIRICSFDYTRRGR